MFSKLHILSIFHLNPITREPKIRICSHLLKFRKFVVVQVAQSLDLMLMNKFVVVQVAQSIYYKVLNKFFYFNFLMSEALCGWKLSNSMLVSYYMS
jgi:hypothetical protein